MTNSIEKPSAGRTLKVVSSPGESVQMSQARLVSDPNVRASVTVEAFSKTFGENDLTALVAELRTQGAHIHSGDLRRAESILAAQAHTLDAIFNELARRSAMNIGEYINAAERYMRLALKAQGQCRATLEALATLRNPSVVIAKQANISAGPQQVNNAPPSVAVGENQTAQNKLLEH